MMGYYDYGYGMWGFGMVFFMALFWIGIIWFIVWLVRQSKMPTNANTPERTPLQILKERYAKGEITKKEFDDMKKDIEK